MILAFSIAPSGGENADASVHDAVAAAVKLLPGPGAKAVAAFSLACVSVMLVLTGWPALAGLGIAIAAVLHRLWADRRRRLAKSSKFG